jgi:hypothetical protein
VVEQAHRLIVDLLVHVPLFFHVINDDRVTPLGPMMALEDYLGLLDAKVGVTARFSGGAAAPSAGTDG